ncbi:MAG: hypothetical protein RRZ91_04315 [Cetobacterium sp.]|uniref:hypothetical protein n=1 Tax=Cetobacterium sp. TaxID=2071632 RepID=UPI002FC845BB
MKIGIFDSGIEGLLVLKELKGNINFADIIYYGDISHNPYNAKTNEEIQNYCLTIGEFFIDNRVSLIIIGCKFATKVVLETMKKRFSSIPIIGLYDKFKISEEVISGLEENSTNNYFKKKKEHPKVEYFVAGNPEQFKKLGELIMGNKMKNVYQVISY